MRARNSIMAMVGVANVSLTLITCYIPAVRAMLIDAILGASGKGRILAEPTRIAGSNSRIFISR